MRQISGGFPFSLLLICLALSACGFRPAYEQHNAGKGDASTFLSQISVKEPNSRLGFYFTKRLEEVLGRGAARTLKLNPKLQKTSETLGTTIDGSTSRVNLKGSVSAGLTKEGHKKPLAQISADGFVGYSTTGSTVATAASEKDAEERLAYILADKVIDKLILLAPDMLPDP